MLLEMVVVSKKLYFSFLPYTPFTKNKQRNSMPDHLVRACEYLSVCFSLKES